MSQNASRKKVRGQTTKGGHLSGLRLWLPTAVGKESPWDIKLRQKGDNETRSAAICPKNERLQPGRPIRFGLHSFIPLDRLFPRHE
jgi:hypothetical protein